VSADDDSTEAGPRMTRFLLVFSGQVFSLFGSELVQFALIWWLTQASGSATTLATAAMLGLLPPVVLGPLAGTLVDRSNRRLVMMAADGVIAAATLVLAALFALGLARVGHVYALMFVRALGATFHWPAMQASTTLMVAPRHLARVAGVSQALRGVANVTMPPLAALLLTSLPLAAILAIDVATALVAITPLVFVCVPQPERRDASAASSVWADLRSGVRFVWEWRGLAVLVALVSFLHFWAAPAFALTPIVVTRTFGRGADGLAWTQSAMGVGFLVGGLLLGAWGGFRRRIVTVVLGISILGVSLGVIGALPRSAFWGLVGAVFVAGVVAPVVVGSFQAIQQAVVPPQMQGRVLSLARSGMDAMSPLGMVAAGPVADGLGIGRWYLLTGAIMVLMAGAASLVPAVMSLERRGVDP
jgi:DHA3 family macrolide efflux protein-like MFS transporter